MRKLALFALGLLSIPAWSKPVPVPNTLVVSAVLRPSRGEWSVPSTPAQRTPLKSLRPPRPSAKAQHDVQR